MKITFLGSGSAFCDKKYNWQSNMLIEHNGKKLLFDCGGDIRHSLSDHGLTSLDIDAIYISHQHADHAGGLEYMAFSTFWSDHKIDLFGEEYMLNDLWDMSLKGTLRNTAKFEEFFNVQKNHNYYYFNWEGIEFTMVRNEHCEGMDSFGLDFITPEDKICYISGDSKMKTEKFYYDFDLIFHDCETMYNSGVHAHFEELKELPWNVKNNMYLYHYQDNVVKDYDPWQTNAVMNGFKEFVPRGAVYEF